MLLDVGSHATHGTAFACVLNFEIWRLNG